MVTPVTETVNPILQSPSTNIQIILIMIFCVIIIICGCLANVLALYQRFVSYFSMVIFYAVKLYKILLLTHFYLFSCLRRYVGKRSIKRSDDFVYGGMEGLDVLTSQRDMVLNQADVAPEPLPLVEEMTYESQELKMDLFMDEIPEDEFISGEFLTIFQPVEQYILHIFRITIDIEFFLAFLIGFFDVVFFSDLFHVSRCLK